MENNLKSMLQQIINEHPINLPINNNTISMIPLIQRNARIEVRKHNKLKLGDIITFLHDDVIICHRIIKIRKNKLVTKGDYNLNEDETININDVIGKVSFIHYEKYNFSINLSTKKSKILSFLISNIKKTQNGQKWQNHINTISKFYFKNKQRKLLSHNIFKLPDNQKIFVDVLKHYIQDNLVSFDDNAIDQLSLLAKQHKTEFIIYWLKQEKNVYSKLNKIRQERRLLECRQVFDALKINKINYCILKGHYLSEVAYKNSGDRWFNDIDVLIDKSQIDIAKKIILNHGFIAGYWDLNLKQCVPYSRATSIFYATQTHQLAPFVKSIDDPLVDYVELDVNIDIRSSQSIIKSYPQEYIFGDLKLISINSVEYPVCNNELFLITLCSHFYKDSNSLSQLVKNKRIYLRNIIDIYYFIYKSIKEINIDKLIDKIITLNLADEMYFSLYHVNYVFDCVYTQEILKLVPLVNKDIINQYGIDYKKQWNADIWERIFCDDIYELMKPNLSEKELNHIQVNMKFMNST